MYVYMYIYREKENIKLPLFYIKFYIVYEKLTNTLLKYGKMTDIPLTLLISDKYLPSVSLPLVDQLAHYHLYP